MTQIDVSVLAPDAQRVSAAVAMNYIAPGYAYPWGFSRAVVPQSPAPTYETPATHWRAADQTEEAYAIAWQYVAVNGELPEEWTIPDGATMTEQEIIDAMVGVRVWIGNDVGDSVTWARDNMNALAVPLMDRPQRAALATTRVARSQRRVRQKPSTARSKGNHGRGARPNRGLITCCFTDLQASLAPVSGFIP